VKKLLTILLSLLVCASAMATESSGSLVTATFTGVSATSGTVLNNPYRGILTQSTGCCGTNNSMMQAVQTYSISSGDSVNGGRGLLCTADLQPYIGGHIPTSALSNLQANLNNIRAAGMFCMFLPGYNLYAGVDAGQSLNDILTHLADLTPILQSNADVIPYARAGMIGFYGQWFGATTTNGNAITCGYAAANSCPGNATIQANQVAIRNAIMAAYSPFTRVGFPGISPVAYWYGTTPISATAAFTGTYQSRTTLDDDCVLSGPSSSVPPTNIGDSGMFLDGYGVGFSVSQYNALWHAAAEFLGFYGEISDSCGTGSGNAQFTTCAQALAYWPYFHGTLFKLIASDGTNWQNAWQSGGCMTQIGNTMGYRIQYDSISHQGTAVHGQTVSATIGLRNVGWSRVAQPVRVNWTMCTVAGCGSGNVVTCQSRVDLRELPDQATNSFTVTVPTCLIPNAGTYIVYLSMPPIWSTLLSNFNYWIQPANTGTYSNGLYTTGTTIVVS